MFEVLTTTRAHNKFKLSVIRGISPRRGCVEQKQTHKQTKTIETNNNFHLSKFFLVKRGLNIRRQDAAKSLTFVAVFVGMICEGTMGTTQLPSCLQRGHVNSPFLGLKLSAWWWCSWLASSPYENSNREQCQKYSQIYYMYNNQL